MPEQNNEPSVAQGRKGRFKAQITRELRAISNASSMQDKILNIQKIQKEIKEYNEKAENTEKFDPKELTDLILEQNILSRRDLQNPFSKARALNLAAPSPPKPVAIPQLLIPLENLYNENKGKRGPSTWFRKSPEQKIKAEVIAGVKTELKSILAELKKLDLIQQPTLVAGIRRDKIKTFEKNLNKHATELVNTGKIKPEDLLESILNTMHPSPEGANDLRSAMQGKLNQPTVVENPLLKDPKP